MKKMNCGELRDRLTRNADARHEPSTARHIEECATCRTFANRRSTARQLLRRHHGHTDPDAGFSGRVMARLPKGPTEVLGWAAVRLLPATVALALVLVWFNFQVTPHPTTVETATVAPTEDLLTWVIDPTGGEE